MNGICPVLIYLFHDEHFYGHVGGQRLLPIAALRRRTTVPHRSTVAFILNCPPRRESDNLF